ncbi:MAG: Dihydroneopterin aldolase [Ignavibacteriae bacterium]|nr:MAG: Dihydroneopterin aldolase [Ignavibacteriota bacterium]
MDTDIIRIKNAVFYAYHGADIDEQKLGGKFEVDLEIHTNFKSAIASDRLKDTIDYEKVYSTLKNIVSEKRYFLLETLANRIADEILNRFIDINFLTVKVRKPHPPVKGVVDYVEIEVSRNRRI